jgi:hypothetical protein
MTPGMGLARYRIRLSEYGDNIFDIFFPPFTGGMRRPEFCLQQRPHLQHRQNSNVVRFFRSLVKDDPEKQLVYYQASLASAFCFGFF